MLPQSLSDCEALDRADPLRAFRDRFALPEGVIYLDGNSLGPLPRATPARLAEVATQEWGERLIGSWNEAGWWDAPVRIGDKIATLLGADEGEVVATDSTSVNLYKLVVAAAALKPGAILVENDNFPTDGYIVQQAAELLGRDCRSVPGAALAEAIDDSISVVVATQVNYRTAARHDIAALEARAARAGAHIVWDLSHSIGAVPVDLPGDGASLAIGCGYKYLNGGPGAPAWLYVAKDLQDRFTSPIAGWWSHTAPFAFVDRYEAATGIRRFLAGTQPMLSLLALETGVDLFLEADMAEVWAKSIRLFDVFAARLEATCPGLEIRSPRDPARRGSHIALGHPHAYAIVQALIERGIVGDFRAPDIARFGLTPLTLSFADIWRATEALSDVVNTGTWKDPRYGTRSTVT